MGEYLRRLCVPDDAKIRILDAYGKARPESAERDAARRNVEGHLRRLADFYQLGELERAEYDARRSALRAQLAGMAESEVHGRPEVLDRLLRYLADAGQAWQDAAPAQRNRLARVLFEGVVMQDGRVVAVRPRPEFRPYLVLAQAETPPVREASSAVRSGGPEGIRDRYFPTASRASTRLRGLGQRRPAWPPTRRGAAPSALLISFDRRSGRTRCSGWQLKA